MLKRATDGRNVGTDAATILTDVIKWVLRP